MLQLKLPQLLQHCEEPKAANHRPARLLPLPQPPLPWSHLLLLRRLLMQQQVVQLMML